MDTAEQDRLIRAAQAGDASAFEALVNAHYAMMYRIAFRRCGQSADAQDITQDACIKLARGLGSYRFNAAFSSWLYRLVINAANDWYRSRAAQPLAGHGDIETISVPATGDERLQAQAVLKAVQGLPEGERDAVLLVLADGLSHREAAEILGCKESTVSWRIHEARKKLAVQFGKDGSHG